MKKTLTVLATVALLFTVAGPASAANPNRLASSSGSNCRVEYHVSTSSTIYSIAPGGTASKVATTFRVPVGCTGWADNGWISSYMQQGRWYVFSSFAGANGITVEAKTI